MFFNVCRLKTEYGTNVSILYIISLFFGLIFLLVRYIFLFTSRQSVFFFFLITYVLRTFVF